MATIRGQARTIPIDAAAALISVSDTPGGGTVDLELELVECVVAMAGADMSRCVFRRRTGDLMHPHESAFADHDPDWDMLGKWVSVSFTSSAGKSSAQFDGVVVDEATTLMGTDEGKTGAQTWTAYGPLYLMRRVTVAKSYWLDTFSGSSVVEVEGVPSFNLRDELGMLVGNRSASVVGTSYVFGGTSTWTRRQAVEYLLARFGPTQTWTVSGDTDLLDVAADVVEMGSVGTLANAVRRILSPTFGMDFVIDTHSGSFEVRVCSLSERDVTVRGYTLPRNSRRWRAEVGVYPDVRSIRIHRSHAQRYSRLRVIGERAVVCFSLDASRGHLVPKWSAASETQYLAGTGTPSDSSTLHDLARTAPDLHAVFASYGAPAGFALQGVNAAPEFDADGSLSGTAATHPDIFRSTERWLPLRAGYDYSTGAEVSRVITNHEADFLPPLAFVYDETESRYVPADAAGLSLAVPHNDWGVVLRGRANHVLALNNWAGAADSAVTPLYDQSKTVATIAIRSGFRLALEVQLEADDDGTVLEVYAPGAEFWLAAEGTAYGVAADGTLQTFASSLTLRNDADALRALAAGQVARYLQSRARGAVDLEGYQAYTRTLGYMLHSVRQGGNAEDIGAPITSVAYLGGTEPRTLIRAGYSA